MNTYFILISLLYGLLLYLLLIVFILKNIDILTLLFIQYITNIIATISIYFNLPKEQTTQLFTKEYSYLWIYYSFTSLIGVISWYYYYNCVNILGPAKSQLIWSITKTIGLFAISIYILYIKL